MKFSEKKPTEEGYYLVQYSHFYRSKNRYAIDDTELMLVYVYEEEVDCDCGDSESSKHPCPICSDEGWYYQLMVRHPSYYHFAEPQSLEEFHSGGPDATQKYREKNIDLWSEKIDWNKNG